MPDADEMLRNAQFVHADCAWLDGRFVAWRLEGDRVVLDERIAVDTADLADADCRFDMPARGARYGGGDSTAHGSCGFFFKRGADGAIEWALFCLASDPFVGVEVTATQARFRSQSGDVWVVPGDAVARTRIERARTSRD